MLNGHHFIVGSIETVGRIDAIKIMLLAYTPNFRALATPKYHIVGGASVVDFTLLIL